MLVIAPSCGHHITALFGVLLLMITRMLNGVNDIGDMGHAPEERDGAADHARKDDDHDDKGKVGGGGQPVAEQQDGRRREYASYQGGQQASFRHTEEYALEVSSNSAMLPS